MEIRKFEIDGKQVEFVNQSRGTRSGFAHDTTIFIGGCNYGEATCHYLNRTWERFTYQTVMRKVVNNLMDELEYRLKVNFKEYKGYKQMTAKRQAEFEEFLKGNTEMEFYRKLLDALA